MDHSDQDPGSLGMDNNDEQEFTAEFYNFEEERSEEKFKQGQIWAIYSDIDEYPNYYGLIKEADWEGAGFVSLKWLELLPMTEKEKLLLENNLSVGCGRFKVVSGIQRYESTCAFSHVVHAKAIRKNTLYEIYPNIGDVWAVLKNRSGNVDGEKLLIMALFR
ncbi:hypothetical protein HPP92_016071 [Vanilla planifolia]|uniref:DUF3444 domain-containing protein n=1 Tax=Vanilla planifolia TaxID=51239 RepID=A0A835QKD2_VANPL|nr:hypothetical protein HPP92_016071 [Vanilla planifolia]